MTKQERINIDLQGLRERIENFRSDPAWVALSLSKKIRILIGMGLSQGEAQPSPSNEPPKTLGTLIADHWALLQKSNIPVERLEELRDGAKPTAAEQVRIGSAIDDVELVINLAEKLGDKKRRKSGNGV